MRRIGRVLAWIALSTVLVILLAAITLVLWARSESGRRIILSTAVSTAQKRLAGRLTIGALEGDLTRHITLRQIRVYDREHKLAVTVEAVRVEYDLIRLLSRRLLVRSLAVEGTWVHARFLRDGRLNLAALEKERPPPSHEEVEAARSGGRGWEIAIRGLRVNAQLAIESRAGGPPLHGVLAIAGGGRWQAGAPTFDDLRAHFVTDGHEVDRVQSSARFAGPLEVTLHVAGPRDGIDAELSIKPARGALHATAHASMPLGGSLRWRATARAEDLDPSALLPSAPGGRVRLVARARGDASTASIDVDSLTFDAGGANASIQGAVELGATLTADVRADVRASELSRLTGSWLPELQGSVDAHAHLRRASTHTYVDASMNARGLRFGTTHLETFDARVHAKDTVGRVVVTARHVETSPAHGHSVRLRSFALTATGDDAHIGLTLDVYGQDGAIAMLRAHGVPLPHQGRWAADVALDTLTVGARAQAWHLVAPGRLRIDRRELVVALAMAAHEQALDLRGSFERASGQLDVTMRGRRLDVSRWAAIARVDLPQTVLDVDAQLRGTRRSPELTMTLRGRTLPWPQHHLPAIALVVEGAGDAQRLHATIEASAHVELSQLPIESFRAPRVVNAGVVELTLDVRGSPRSADASATLSGTIRGEPILAARAESHFDLAALIHGEPWQNARVGGSVTISASDLSLLGDLGGTVDGAGEISGTLGHPTGKAELRVRDLRLSDLRLTRLDARASWKDHVLTATLDGAEPSGGALHADIHLPTAADAPMRATLQARAFSFALANVGRVRRLEGALDADVHVAGIRAHPTLAGFLRIDRGSFAAGSDPRLFRELALELAAHDNIVELRRLQVSVDRGSLTAHGSAAFDGLKPAVLDLVADAYRFPFSSSSAEAWVNAGVELHGRRVNNVLEGTLTVSRGSARLPAMEKQRSLQPTGSLEDVVYVDEAGQAQDHAAEPDLHEKAPPKLAVIAHIPGPFRVESPEMHAELRGELEVRSVEGAIGIYGHGETTAGQVELLGRSYTIERARANFDGDTDPEVDVRLTREVSNATVVISVHGTASAPELELSSEPPVYDASQVLGLIVSADPDNPRLDTSTLNHHLAGAVGGMLASTIKGLIPGLPIDVIRVDTTFGGADHTRIEVGKYIRQNIYVSYVHHFGATMNDVHRTNSHEASFEYRFRTHLVIGVRYGDAGIGKVDVAWTLRH